MHLDRALQRVLDRKLIEQAALRTWTWARCFRSSSLLWQEPSSTGVQDQLDQREDVDPRHRQKLRRKDFGSYASAGEALEEEVEGTGLVWPDNRPAYDIATQMHFYTQPSTQFAAMDELAQAVEQNDVQQLTRILSNDVPSLMSFKEALLASKEGTAAGRDAILHWELNMVLHTGPDGNPHPMDKKVKCMVHLRDLQQVGRLSDQALRHVALICGPRYDASSGQLTLVSTCHDDREANRRDIVRTIHMLLEAGQAHSKMHDNDVGPQQHANA